MNSNIEIYKKYVFIFSMEVTSFPFWRFCLEAFFCGGGGGKISPKLISAANPPLFAEEDWP